MKPIRMKITVIQMSVKSEYSKRLWRQIIEMDRRTLEDMLKHASRLGDIESAIKLLNSGADINSRNGTDGWTALHWACKYSQPSMVSVLLSRGANTSLRTLAGQTARELAVSPDVIAVLQAAESPPTSPNSRSPTDYSSYEPPQNMVNHVRHENNHLQQNSTQDIIIKVRIANMPDPDFIEVEIPGSGATYQGLVAICSHELEINMDQVDRIRKLPDTRVRSDADVRRLRPLQELEVVLKEVQTSNHLSPTNIYPSISTDRNQTVLY